MGAITWTAPAALWLLLLVPVVFLAHLVSRTNFNRHQGRLQAALRSLLLAALVVALARPVASTRSSRQSIVYAVDISHSVGSPAIGEAARRIDELNAALRPDHFRIVVFGATARSVENTAALRQVAQLDPEAADPNQTDRRGTDLEAALDAARGELASDHIPRIVLFSDGRPTAGDLRAAITRLATARVPVSVEPLAVRSLGDSWVSSIDTPDVIHATAPFPVTITIGSQRDGTADVQLRSGAKVLARQSVPVAKGLTAVTMDAVADAPGALVLEAAVSVPGDPLSANDSLSRGLWADTRVRVLYVEGTPASARYLSGALTGSGFDVTLRPPSGLPANAAGFDPYDVVILSDIARDKIPNSAMASLPGWVEHGGGLLVAGGEAVFGEGENGPGGYRRTPLEGVTPVTFERKEEPTLALVLVLDRSWSMAGSAMNLCAGGAGGGRRDEGGAVGRHPDVQRPVRLGREGQERRPQSRRHPREDRGDRAGRPDADLSRARTGVPRAQVGEGARQARRPPLRRPDLSRSVRSARQEDGRCADHRVVGRGRPVGRPGAPPQHRRLGEGAGVPGRGPEGAAADFREGSEERVHTRV